MEEIDDVAGPVLVETSYTASRVVALRQADALVRWLRHRPGRARRATLRGALLVTALALITVGVGLSTGGWTTNALGVALGGGAALVVLQLVVAPLLARRQWRRTILARVLPGTTSRARFTSSGVELETPTATHRVEYSAVVSGAWVDRDLVLETPGLLWYVVPRELLDDDARALVAAALEDRLVVL